MPLMIHTYTFYFYRPVFTACSMHLPASMKYSSLKSMRGITIGPNIIKATLLHVSVVALIILLSGTLPRNINKPFSRTSPPDTDTPMMSTPQAAKAVSMVQLSSISSPSGIPSEPFIFTIMITPGPPGSLSLSTAARMRLSTSQSHCMHSYIGTPLHWAWAIDTAI